MWAGYSGVSSLMNHILSHVFLERLHSVRWCVEGMGDEVSSLLPALGEVARHHGYRQHLSLLETLLHRLPHLARGLGKRPFKDNSSSSLTPSSMEP